MAFHGTCKDLESKITVNGVKKAPKKVAASTPAPTIIIPAKMSRFLAVGNAPLPKVVKPAAKVENKPQEKKAKIKQPVACVKKVTEPTVSIMSENNSVIKVKETVFNKKLEELKNKTIDVLNDNNMVYKVKLTTLLKAL